MGGSAATTSSMTIGQQTGGLGLVTITGPGSSLAFTSSSGLTVGNSGFAQMEISNGAVVNLGSFGQLRISQNESSFGTLTVDGTGTLLQVGGSMTVGGSNSLGDALLRISNGAIVNSTNNTLTINAIGRLELDGGLLRASQFANGGLVSGNGELMILASSTVSNAGRIEAAEGDLLRLTGGSGDTFMNNGTIFANGGEIQISRIVNSGSQFPGGRIELRNGVVRTGMIANFNSPKLFNSSLLVSTGGVNDFYGQVTNTGTIAATNDSTLIFHDDVAATQSPGFGTVEVVGLAQLATCN
jgi:T5SS/PEP-CTERM-associated repeat protein